VLQCTPTTDDVWCLAAPPLPVLAAGSPTEIRSLSLGASPERLRVNVSVPGCSSPDQLLCAYSDLRKLLAQSVQPQCMSPGMQLFTQAMQAKAAAPSNGPEPPACAGGGAGAGSDGALFAAMIAGWVAVGLLLIAVLQLALTVKRLRTEGATSALLAMG
jgi:hypothetical protein